MQNGFWRDSNNTSVLNKCNEDWHLCFTDSSALDRSQVYCKEGYSGSLCESCLDSSKYFDPASGECKVCNSKNLLLMLALWSGGLCVAVVLLTILSKKFPKIANVTSNLNLHVKIKIFITFYQILSSLEPVYNVKVDESLSNAMNFMNLLSFDFLKLFPLECIGGKIVAYVMSATWPLVLCGAIMIVVASTRLFPKTRSKRNIHLLQIIIMIFYFTLPVVTQSLVRVTFVEEFWLWPNTY